jgi:signal transduction histidine kinase
VCHIRLAEIHPQSCIPDSTTFRVPRFRTFPALSAISDLSLLYSRGVAGSRNDRSPTLALVLGLLFTLAAVIAYSSYINRQITGLRALQNNLVDRDRRDSLQLLRIQNDLNSLALAMRDMLDNDEPYPLAAWSSQFERIRTDLDDALQKEQQVAPADRTPDQQQYLAASMAQFWDASERIFALARNRKEQEARSQIRVSLQARQDSLSTAVSRLLVENNESEERATARIAGIYDRVERQVYLFLIATLAAILATGLYLIRTSRRIFAQLATLSEQRSELAQELISTQESTLRFLSRELHDEFGQVLTAIGSMLTRAQKDVPAGSRLTQDLLEVRDIAQNTLDKVRTLSQSLHPVMLDEAGLENTLDWYLPVVERQTGIKIRYERPQTPIAIDGDGAIHIYRILQEALNNVARHSGAKEAWVRVRSLAGSWEFEVEDHGSGFFPAGTRPGMGLVAMRERAELLGGCIDFSKPASGGTLVRLQVPRQDSGAHGQ